MNVCIAGSRYGQLILATFLAMGCSSASVIAQEATTEAGGKAASESADLGQADLNEAVVSRLDAESDDELESVAALLESALKKGLGGENETFAKKMLGSVLLQRSRSILASIPRSRGRERLELQDEAIETLEEAVRHDPELVEAYMMIARLNLLPGGNKDAITNATSKAIELLNDEPSDQSAAYLLRALTQDDDDMKLADLDSAVRVDHENFEALQARAGLRLEKADVEGAIKDLEIVLQKDPNNEVFAEAVVRKLSELNHVEDAKSLITRVLETKPSEGMYRLRADLSFSHGKSDEAMSDLNKAIAMKPKDPVSLLQRALVSLEREDVKSAKEDLRSAIQIAPQITQLDRTISLRSLIAVQENRFADAINDMQLLVDRRPDEPYYRLRLANLYSLDERPRKAIDVLTAALEVDANSVAILRSRGDALLSVGDHTSAIEDYEDAIDALGKIEESATDAKKSEAAGIYNNLAWVLATSPNDSVRNGKRAVELGEMAAELSEYNEAHILSTLAAAFAEVGDFPKAIEWSTKSVDLGSGTKEEEEHAQLDQLKKELDSYKAGKAWREKQETEENTVPILSPEDLIDT